MSAGKLTVDRATGDVQTYTVRNVARTARSDSDLVAAYPRVAEVSDRRPGARRCGCRREPAGRTHRRRHQPGVQQRH